jgi:hypothetical protein
VLEREKTVHALDRSTTAIGHIILNHSKLAYRIYVILIANKELKKRKKEKRKGLRSSGPEEDEGIDLPDIYIGHRKG